MRVVFLGTGTSHGVPMIACDCRVCTSPDPRDQRMRTSIVVELDSDFRILVDTTPDLRTQALRHGVRRVDAILYTHAHADHLFGLDEVRRFNILTGRPMPVFASDRTLADIRTNYSYVFGEIQSPGTYRPQVHLWRLAGPFCLGGASIVPVPIMHGQREIFGYRFGTFAYLTDCSAIPESSMPLLEGVDVLVLDALRHKPHPTHLSLEQSIALATRIAARQTYFIHMCHDLGHADTCASLPEGMTLAYDGLAVDL